MILVILMIVKFLGSSGRNTAHHLHEFFEVDFAVAVVVYLFDGLL